MKTESTRAVYAPNYTGPRLFGAPVGDFSLFQTVLISLATGVASFFGATFLAIMTILVLTQATSHKTIDFAIAYRWIGLPVGIVMLVLTSGYLFTLFALRIKRQTAR